MPKAKILLVDDRPTNLHTLRAVLEDLGHELVESRSGEEAVRLLAADGFAVALLDIRLGQGMNGFQTAQEIRRQERSRHTPIIFLTAFEAPDFSAAQAYRLGAVDYLVKPVEPVILRAKVQEFVGLFQEREQLRLSEERYRLLVETVKDYAIYMLDPEGHVVTWNAGAERFKGYTAEEIVGQHFSRFYPPEEVAAGKPQRTLQAAAAEGRVEEEAWRVRKDGSRFWAHVVVTALRDSAGRLQGFAKVTRDLTDRRRAEEQQRQLTRAEAAREAAEAASRRKDEFLSMLAHELRNPLAPVLTGLTIFRQGDADPPTRERVLNMMERQVRHLVRLVDDLLDVARFTRGKVQLQMERLDLARLVRSTAEDRRPLLEQAGLTLTVDAPEVPVWVQGDPTRLAQVLTNLLDNSAKFTDRGGQVEVRLTRDTDQEQAVLTVRDTGVGIAPDLLPRLFDAFAQAEQGLARARGGLGLGLAVVRGLVRLHGGEVTVDSEGPGRGALFTARLPMEPEPAALVTIPGEAKHAGRRLKVVVVEDNQDAAETLRMLLQLLGHEARVAYNGPEGVKAATEWQPDVVLSDIGLPGGLDGYGVAEALRRHPATAQARLVAVSGYGSDEDRRRSREAGFDFHLVKPADPEELLRLLEVR